MGKRPSGLFVSGNANTKITNPKCGAESVTPELCSFGVHIVRCLSGLNVK